MDLIDARSDPWILEYDACEKVFRGIMEHLNARNSEKTSFQTFNALSAKISIKIKQFSTELSELNRKLSLASVVSNLTPEERERRKRLVEALQSKEVQLKDYFDQRNNGKSELIFNKSRAQLFEKKKGDMGITSYGENRIRESDDDFDSRAIVDMKSENERLLKEQNDGLESLLKIVTGQKQIASTMYKEVEHHNEILVDIADGMERVDGKMTQATNMVEQVGKKDGIWGYWLIAFLLLIAILSVAFV